MSTNRHPIRTESATAGHGLRLAHAMKRCIRGGPSRERSFLIAGEMRSIRLEPELWLALDGIALTEGVMAAFIVEQAANRRPVGTGLASAVRGFVLAYHRRG